jgi:tRNA threonylcarbamoyladenosine biosynthesis protein TsaB
VTQGLAWGLDIPVAPVSTLQALALAAGNGDVWAVLDARMNEVYAAEYRVSGDGVEELSPPVCQPPAVLPAPTFSRGSAIGDGFAAYPELQSRAAGLTVHSDGWPTASAVARLGARMFAQGGGVAAIDAQPIYVRDKVALTTAERLARGGVR